jgi:hypothetical protein
MIRVFQILVLSFAVLLSAGCRGGVKEEPIWEQLKIGDLSTSGVAERPEERLLKTLNFEFDVFEIPVEDVNILEDVWPMLSIEHLQFRDYDSFRANSFSIGFGQLPVWDEIADLLRGAGGRRVESDALLLMDGQTRELGIASVERGQTIFYISTEGPKERATTGSGGIFLRIKVERIPGSRGVCNFTAEPVFLPSRDRTATKSATGSEADLIFFDSCRFGSKMSPGDFVFFGPAKYVSERSTLSGLFFSRTKPRPVVRTYLIVCAGIID